MFLYYVTSEEKNIVMLNEIIEILLGSRSVFLITHYCDLVYAMCLLQSGVGPPGNEKYKNQVIITVENVKKMQKIRRIKTWHRSRGGLFVLGASLKLCMFLAALGVALWSVIIQTDTRHVDTDPMTDPKTNRMTDQPNH